MLKGCGQCFVRGLLLFYNTLTIRQKADTEMYFVFCLFYMKGSDHHEFIRY
ncbi:hypothetical protein ANACAC_03099 [Anaerostipes caccae L1-92]|uniref:Uncharacterized protein n=1 Tax=Anaerostipes caccae (strain DSM 14662 / CCUG 47493 / JCM 13470 / NCIMB 13811 / L1-92) TaxID=411490 RepID=B0MHY7_ANACD|nr:hypothetical protein ANACAC_03099 [Anaerostipes caccae L1-92]